MLIGTKIQGVFDIYVHYSRYDKRLEVMKVTSEAEKAASAPQINEKEKEEEAILFNPEAPVCFLPK